MTEVGQRYRGFIERHEVAWELSFAALAVIFVLAGLIPEDEYPWVLAFDWLITGIFAIEFFSRLAVAPSRRDYMRGHAVDLISLVPPMRMLRVLRLARLLRLIRVFAGIGRALSTMDRFARHRGLMWLFVSWGAVMVVCSLVLYAAEVGPNEHVDDPMDALWWGISTLTTVGYGDVYPVTDEGRIAAAVLMILGIGLYSVIIATLTSALMSRGEAIHEPAALIRSLAALRDDGHIDEATFRAKRDEILTRI